MIDVTLLGTAALAPIPERALAAAALQCAGRVLLFDCGEGTQTAARRFGVSLMRADVIALTHYHGDHTFGLPGLLQTMNVQGRTSPIHITGPEGLSEALAPILQLTGHTDYDVRLIDIPPEGLSLHALAPAWPAGARLRAFPTRHRVPSQGYVFALERAGRFLPERARALGVPVGLWGNLQRGQSVGIDGRTVDPAEVLGPGRRGLTVACSGDTAACDELVEASRGVDLLICEATYGENGQAEMATEYGHMTFSQAAAVAARAGARRLWLTHYSQMITDPMEYLPNAQAIYENAVCGADGMRETLRFEEE